jgi:putative transposase
LTNLKHRAILALGFVKERVNVVQASSSGHSRRSKKIRIKGDPSEMLWEEFQNLERRRRIQLIQELIPIGLMAVSEELQREVSELLDADASKPEPHRQDLKRYGSNPGTVRLSDQILPVRVPRLRGRDGELSLESYRLLHAHPELDAESVFKKVSSGVSTRDLENILQPAKGSIGASKSSISRKAVAHTAKLLKEFRERSLAGFEVLALFIDGTSFAGDQMIIAMGINSDGHKKALGFTQASTEHHQPVADLLRELLSRGLQLKPKVLVCIDGSKGLRKAVQTVFQGQAVIQRCQWHKRENVASYLPKGEQEAFKKRLQLAFDRPTYVEAKEAVRALENELERSNQNALRSLQEGQDEIFTLHRLGIFPALGMSFKTTNCIESLNALAKAYCRRIRKWTDCEQKQRWLAAALLDAEPGLRRVKGYAQLNALEEAMRGPCKTLDSPLGL